MKPSLFFAVAALALALPASATVHVYTAQLSGASEFPSNGSAGSGMVTVALDDVLSTLDVDASFSALTATTTAAHIHCCTAAAGTGNAMVATPTPPTPSFPGFPLGVTSGSYSQVFDLTQSSSYNASFVTAVGGSAASAFTALSAGLAKGEVYFNVHTSAYPAGEIRGFLMPVSAVPEPATGAMLLAGLGAVAAAARRRRR